MDTRCSPKYGYNKKNPLFIEVTQANKHTKNKQIMYNISFGVKNITIKLIWVDCPNFNMHLGNKCSSIASCLLAHWEESEVLGGAQQNLIKKNSLMEKLRNSQRLGALFLFFSGWGSFVFLSPLFGSACMWLLSTDQSLCSRRYSPGT